MEQLFPQEINKESNLIIKICDERIPKVKIIKQVLPNTFNSSGSVVIRDYYFDTIISRLNNIIGNQYSSRSYSQIKNDIRSMMISINHADKHKIANQHGKLILLRIIKSLKTSTHYNNLHQTVDIVVHLISQCLVLNQKAFKEYLLLIKKFDKTHNS